MNKKEIVENCIQLIDQNYYFTNGQQKDWTQKKSRILSKVEKTESEEEAFEVLNNYIYELHDPHTRLFYTVCPEYIISESIYFDHGVLWYCEENEYKKILSVNNIDTGLLIKEYQKIFYGYPIALIEDEIVKDIQLLQHRFKCDCITLSCESGEKIYLHPILFNQWIEDIHSLTQDKEPEPIYIERVDCETICIKILSFRIHELYNKLKEKIEMYSGNYSTVILDVRNNVGGYVEEAKQIVRGIIGSKVDLGYSISYMEEGCVVEAKCDITPIKERLFKNKRILVFMNYRTMSAAEYIFAKSLQQDGICIVGEKSAGLKDQAEVFDVDHGIIIQITTKRFIKNGKYLKEKVIPDICINPTVIYPQSQDAYILWYKQINTQIVNQHDK